MQFKSKAIFFTKWIYFRQVLRITEIKLLVTEVRLLIAGLYIALLKVEIIYISHHAYKGMSSSPLAWIKANYSRF